MTRATIPQLEQAVKDLTAVTGKRYYYSPRGSGFWDFGVGEGDKVVGIANKKLADLIVFIDAYRRGYGACLDDNKGDRRAAKIMADVIEGLTEYTPAILRDPEHVKRIKAEVTVPDTGNDQNDYCTTRDRVEKVIAAIEMKMAEDE